MVTLPDGNPDDGETSLLLPDLGTASLFTLSISTPPQGAAAAVEISPDIIFPSPATLTMLYQDLDDDGLEDTTGADETTLSVFYWDGFAWRQLGGNNNSSLNTVSVRIMHLSKYALFPAEPLAKTAWSPREKIITPALLDGYNDYAQFQLDGEFTIKIFDLQGSLIRSLKNISIWRGENDDGTIVETGSYIYQIEKDGERTAGMITVAK